jgi:hypothetical protein
MKLQAVAIAIVGLAIGIGAANLKPAKPRAESYVSGDFAALFVDRPDTRAFMVSRADCGACVLARAWIADNQIAGIDVIDISEQPDLADRLTAAAPRKATPTLVLRDAIMVGFQDSRWEELLQP